jgi:RNA polymerase sigma-70 factor (ECF subfamily)
VRRVAAARTPERPRPPQSLPRSTPGARGGEDPDRATKNLVAAAQRGDSDAMARLYVSFAPGVQAYVGRIVGRQDAQDVAQQVFVRLLSELPRYRPSDAPFSAWLLRVARNLAVDHRRHSRDVPVPVVRGSAEASYEIRRECIDSLRDALAPLTVAQRQVLVLQDLAGLSPPEIADRMGRSVHSVHCLHNRALSAARAALDDDGDASAAKRPSVREEVARGLATPMTA